MAISTHGSPLQYSCLENPMDRGAWWAAVHGVAKSRTRLSNFTFPFHFHALEKEMATHSSVLAWRIPGMGEPGGLPFLGSHRVGHDWSDLAAAAAASTHLSIITLSVNGLNASIKRHRVADEIKKQTNMICTVLLIKDSLQGERHTQTEGKRNGKRYFM